MRDPATIPAPAHDPAAQPGRFARVLDLVRRVIDYGKELAATLARRSADSDVAAHGYRFGTSDIGLILTRITQGLHRAEMLEARLARIAPRLNAKPAAAPSHRKPRAAPVERHAEATDPRLAHLPTPEQIAAEVRRRPIGAVIADICRDLGILPSHPLWRELSIEIICHGGSLARLFNDICDRLFPLSDAAPTTEVPPGFMPLALPAGTGPP